MPSNLKGDASDLASFEAQLQSIIGKAHSPIDFASLTIEQRKYLFALILASMVPADGLIRDVEMKYLLSHLAERYHMQAVALERAASLVSHPVTAPESVHRLAGRLPDLLSIEDRASMVGILWELALCDKDLHANEEDLIYKIADKVGVARKKVAELQARAAARLRA